MIDMGDDSNISEIFTATATHSFLVLLPQARHRRGASVREAHLRYVGRERAAYQFYSRLSENTGMEPIYKLRATSQYSIAIAFGICATLILLVQLKQVGTHGLAGTFLFCLGLTLLGFVLYALPHVEVNAEGVVIANTFTTTCISFADLIDIETQWGLTFTTAKLKARSRSFGSSAASARQFRAPKTPQRADIGAHKASHDSSYQPGNPIPEITSGQVSLRATTFTTARLVEDMRTGASRTSSSEIARECSSLTTSRSLAWARILLTACSLALLGLGVALL